MPPLPQNFGSWFLVLLMLVAAAAAGGAVTTIGERAGASRPLRRRTAVALTALLAICALLPLRYYGHALAFVPPVLLAVVGARLTAGRLQGGRLRLLWWGSLVLLLGLFLLALAYSVIAVSAVETVRRLSLDDAPGIALERMGRPDRPIRVAGEADTATVLAALARTVPYQPERGEVFANGYKATVQTRRGPICFELYRGRAGRPDTCVLRFTRRWGRAAWTSGLYESDDLYWALTTRYELPAWFPEGAGAEG